MDMNTMRQHIARAAKAERERLGMNRVEFAKALGIGRANYTEVEKGRRCLTVVHISNAMTNLGIPFDVFLKLKPERCPSTLSLPFDLAWSATVLEEEGV